MKTQTKISLFLTRYEKLIPPALFLFFAILTTPGISWGALGYWNVDELVGKVNLAFSGDWGFFDNTAFYYPSLPKYVMYAVGKIVYGLGYSRVTFIESARLLSVMLGGLIIILIYRITREAGGSIYVGLLAAFLTISNSDLVQNARFAHNDIYLAFFACLTVFSLIKYRTTGGKLWLYASFFEVGLATSSKYNGLTLILVPIIVLIISKKKQLRGNILECIETLFISLGLSFVGYATGTPKALTWMAWYFKRVIPEVLSFSNYERNPDSVIGLFGQWGVFRSAVGTVVYFLFIISFVWFCVRFLSSLTRKVQEDQARINAIGIILLSILALDIPMLPTQIYLPRYYISIIPLFAVIAGFFIDDLMKYLPNSRNHYFQKSIILGSALIIAFSLLRVVSVMFLFMNDARIPASDFLKTLPEGTSLEFTMYPPIIPHNHFSRAHQYPIYVIKYPNDIAPTSPFYIYNEGEKGLDNRQTNYLVIDSFTYSRFSDKYICQSNQVECDFFKKLLNGGTNYRIIKEFKYSLPWFLPKIELSFVNPVIQVYEKIQR